MPNERTILIVDDNKQLFQSLSQNFKSEGFNTLWAQDGLQATTFMTNERLCAVLLDIMIGDENGVSILSELRMIEPTVPIVMITGFATVESAVQSLKLGAMDYVKKPLDFDELLAVIERAIRVATVENENRELKKQVNAHRPQLCFRSTVMREIFEKTKKLAKTDLSVLILGESGTGKELIAESIHSESQRFAKPMLKVNCASFPETLLDNELFGHERGAYTGADSVFKGVFERAHRSSLFLDEIGDMPLTLQTKILRVLQNDELRRIGGASTISVDIRFIAATNRDLKELIRVHSFREDLYYRLNIAVITVPPLRERKLDIAILTELFLEDYAERNSTLPIHISDSIMNRLEQYTWPGNVRELRNTINYACAVSNTRDLTLADLPPSFPLEENQTQRLDVRDTAEKDLIISTLRNQGFNKKRTAEVLAMSRRNLYNKLTKYGITSPPK